MYHYQFDHELRARDEKIVASGLDLVGSFDENLEQMIESWTQIVKGKISQKLVVLKVKINNSTNIYEQRVELKSAR